MNLTVEGGTTPPTEGRLPHARGVQLQDDGAGLLYLFGPVEVTVAS